MGMSLKSEAITIGKAVVVGCTWTGYQKHCCLSESWGIIGCHSLSGNSITIS